MNKKGYVLYLGGLIAVIVLPLILVGILKEFSPCADLGKAYLGFLLMFVAIIFGVSGNIIFGGFSGAGFIFLLILSVLQKCS